VRRNERRKECDGFFTSDMVGGCRWTNQLVDRACVCVCVDVKADNNADRQRRPHSSTRGAAAAARHAGSSASTHGVTTVPADPALQGARDGLGALVPNPSPSFFQDIVVGWLSVNITRLSVNIRLFDSTSTTFV